MRVACPNGCVEVAFTGAQIAQALEQMHERADLLVVERNGPFVGKVPHHSRERLVVVGDGRQELLDGEAGFFAEVKSLVRRPSETVFVSVHDAMQPLAVRSDKGLQQDVAYLPQLAEGEQTGESFEQASLRYQARMCRGFELMVGEALADDQPRRRVGTEGEVAQENEVLRRVRLSDGKGLRGFVAQVLREAKWQFADGHASTAEGRQRCYNRVYALLNPLRRVKSRNP